MPQMKEKLQSFQSIRPEII